MGIDKEGYKVYVNFDGTSQFENTKRHTQQNISGESTK